MARFLGYDVYDVDRSCTDAAGDDLRTLLLHTNPRSLVLVDASCCGEERVMVLTMRGGKDAGDAAVLRLGWLDVHIQFTLCDFEAFKALASNYLGLKDHKPVRDHRSGPAGTSCTSFSNSKSSVQVASSSSKMTELRALEGLALLRRALTSTASCACSCMRMNLA
jgi:hypothetical protein